MRPAVLIIIRGERAAREGERAGGGFGRVEEEEEEEDRRGIAYLIN